MNNWKIGDWCFDEFELKQIDRIEDGRVNGVTDGFFSKGSWDIGDSIFPVTIRNKRISYYFKNCYDNIHREGPSSLNFPDIHRWLRSKWEQACRTTTYEELEPIMDDLRSFEEDVLKRCHELMIEVIHGIPLMRHRFLK